MEQQTANHSNLEVLAAIYEKMAENDSDTAAKVKQLMEKQIKEEYIIAFCGHFSAGKSSMINYLLKQEVLPSSPIPTSANMVTLQKGRNYADVSFHDGRTVRVNPPFQFNDLKALAKDGDSIASLKISSEQFPLSDACAVMDTPGIDSTDDAHRVSTESALHLADCVFYVMDYNHVQSEVNFLFTRELLEQGKKVYLVVNMIDKHDESELTFSAFQESVLSAFEAWNVRPEQIFYTSVREKDLPNNELTELEQLIRKLSADRGTYAEPYRLPAQRLIRLHAEKTGSRYEEMFADELEPLDSLPDYERKEKEQQLRILLDEKKDIEGRMEEIRSWFFSELDSLLKNAYMMPAAAREAARAFLETHQPDYRAGLFFSKKKTELEREQRLNEFCTILNENVQTQLEWHVKELAVRTIQKAGLSDAELLEQSQAIRIEVTKEFLLGTLKPQANSSGTFVLNYAEDTASSIKKAARNTAVVFLDSLCQKLDEAYEVRKTEISGQLKRFGDILPAFERLQQKTVEMQQTAAELEDLLYGKAVLPANVKAVVESIQSELQQEPEPFHGNASGSAEEAAIEPAEEPAQIIDPEQTISRTDSGGVQKMKQTASDLNQIAGWIRPIKGFSSLSQELADKAERLKKQTFTVALFGAFSAGKSSFANALIGESVLPVSPNPTTAAINRIQPSDSSHPHGTAAVSLKTEDMLLGDVSIALEAFNRKAGSVQEAYEEAVKLLGETEKQSSAQVHLSFLRAFTEGYHTFEPMLGKILTVDMQEFRAYAAEEAKSCFVDSIDLYYDSPLADKGVILVDTPGADSINARHTGTAFEFIKNADAILFITYYNHPFSRADREFLIQLGRVKDSFAMDKMFFVVNAADLARNEEEKMEVEQYIKNQLGGFGIRSPRLFSLSSKQALAEKTSLERSEKESGMHEFEKIFHSFLEHDLTELAVQAGREAAHRTAGLLQDVLEAARQGKADKPAALKRLAEEEAEARDVLHTVGLDADHERLKREIDELLFYCRQRVFFRFRDFFKEAFHPAVLKEGVAIKPALQKALKQFLEALGFDLAQEMRAAGLRTERFVQKLLAEKQEEAAVRLEKVRKNLLLKPYSPDEEKTLEFEPAFSELNLLDFKSELALFKNPKSFFEKNEKEKMAAALEHKLNQPAAAYTDRQSQRLYETFSQKFTEDFAALQKNGLKGIEEAFSGLRAVLETEADTAAIEEAAANIEKLNV